MDRSTKQKINKETQTLNDTIDQLDLTDIYRTFHPKTMNFTFFLSTHTTFSRIDHILGHKSSPGKFQNIEIKMESQINSPKRRIEEMQERFNKDQEEKKSQYIMNNAINEIKNTLEGTNSRIMEAINLALVNSKKLKSVQASFLITMQ